MLVSIAAFQPTETITFPGATFGLPNDVTFDPEWYRGGAWGICIALFVVLVGNALLFFKRGWFLSISDAIIGVFSKPLAGRIHEMINHFVDGLDVFRRPLDLLKANAYSLGVWACGIMVLHCMLAAFHIDAPWYTPFVMQTLLGVFISAPGAPGFVGQFHVPLVIGIVLTVPAASVDTAKAYAIVTHVIQLPPVILFGVYSLMATDLSLGNLARESSKITDQEK